MDKIKKTCHRVTNFVEYCISELTTPQSGKGCARCHKSCADNSYFALESHSLRLCSEKCYKAAYKQFEKYQEALGNGDK